jgi:hypothetical protein
MFSLPSVTGVANSAALLALVELFISLYRLHSQKEVTCADTVVAVTSTVNVDVDVDVDVDGVNPLTNAMQRLTLEGNETTSFIQEIQSIENLFREKVLPWLNYSLSSIIDLQVDSGIRGLYRLATCLPTSFLQPYLDSLICQTFKNKFHNSHPIQEQANRVWNLIVNRNEECSRQTENEFIRLHHNTLLNYLLRDAELINPDLREAAFKALEFLFSHPVLASIPNDNNNTPSFVGVC